MYFSWGLGEIITRNTTRYYLKKDSEPPDKKQRNKRSRHRHTAHYSPTKAGRKKYVTSRQTSFFLLFTYVTFRSHNRQRSLPEMSLEKIRNVSLFSPRRYLRRISSGESGKSRRRILADSIPCSLRNVVNRPGLKKIVVIILNDLP